MLLLSLFKLAFGQLCFNRRLAYVCVPVWGFSNYLTEGVSLKLLPSLLKLALKLAFGQFLFNHMLSCVCEPVRGFSCYLTLSYISRHLKKNLDALVIE